LSYGSEMNEEGTRKAEVASRKMESQAHRIWQPAITSTVRGLCRESRFAWEMDGHE
jgi:hypothetical protein